MHIDVDFFRIAIQKQQREWEAGRWNQVVICGRDGVQQQLVPNEPPIHEEIDGIAVELLDLRTADESTQPEPARERSFLGFRWNRQVSR